MPDDGDDYELFETQLETDRQQVLDVDSVQWRFVPCMESPGHDLSHVGERLSADRLKLECLKLQGQGAVAITTQGSVKHALEPEESWHRMSENEAEGMWIMVKPEAPQASDEFGAEFGASEDAALDELVQSLTGQDRSPTPEILQSAAEPAALPSVQSGRMSGRAETSESSRGRWEQSTWDKLNHARLLTKQATKSMRENDRAHSAASKYNAHTGVVAHSIKQKIFKTADLCKALEDRIESVEDTIRQVGEGLFQLQRSHRSKWAPLNVCERRLELREGRPLQEQVRDACQEALEHERAEYNKARTSLESQIDKMKELIVGLDRVCWDLREDLTHKRHGMRIDRACLSPRKPPSGKPNLKSSKCSSPPSGHEERLVLPALQDVAYYGTPQSPKGAEPGTGPVNEERRQETTQQLVARAYRLEEDGYGMCSESHSLRTSIDQDCTKASNQAQAVLARRVDETQQLKRQLEAQIADTEETIAQTELSLTKTRQALDSHDRPLRALDKQFAARGKKTMREGIRDQVHDEMEGQLEHLKKSVRDLTAKSQNTKDLLDQLKSSKQQLQEDYRSKCLAQKIDDTCMKVTARKAIELDRTDPRGGRCRETPRRKPRSRLGLEAGVAGGVAM